jgi:hypothetical protein
MPFQMCTRLYWIAVINLHAEWHSYRDSCHLRSC